MYICYFILIYFLLTLILTVNEPLYFLIFSSMAAIAFSKVSIPRALSVAWAVITYNGGATSLIYSIKKNNNDNNSYNNNK